MFSRRRFVSLSTALVLAPEAVFAEPAQVAAGRLYIGTGNRGPGQGIMTATWNSQTGGIGAMTLAAEVASPSFLACHRSPAGGVLLYCVSEVSGEDAKVSAYATQPGTGELKLLNRVPAGGNGPTHLSVTPDGRTVLVANYGGGSVSSFLVQADGSLSGAVSHFQFAGSGPYKGRQDAPHTHSALPSPDGRFALVNDLGLDRVMVYSLDSSTAKMTAAATPFWQAKPGSGPRHMAWHPNGRIVYCSNELDSTVETLAWSESPAELHSLQHTTTLPPGFAANTAFVGEIVASSDGRSVYAGNRVADDTVAVFDVDRRSGLLSLGQLAPSGGKNSRHIALDPTGAWMVISHQNSNEVAVLARDTHTGRLSEAKQLYPVTKPMCVVFV